MTDQPIAVVAGPDEHGLGEELEALGVEIRRIEGLVTADALSEVGGSPRPPTSSSRTWRRPASRSPRN